MLIEAEEDRPRGPGRIRRTLRVVTTFLFNLVLAAGIGIALSMVLPPVLGHRVLTVYTGSMVPTLGVGSVVVETQIDAREARVGDIITFPDPENNKRLLTHRLRYKKVHPGRSYMETRGDANDTFERWNVDPDAELGRVVYTLPKMGYVRQQLSGKTLRIAIVAAVVLLGILVLWDVWRPRKPIAAEVEDDEDDEPVDEPGGADGEQALTTSGAPRHEA